MKRILSVIIAITLLVCVISVPVANAQENADYLEIYALNLSESGDSTLLNMSGSWLLIDTGSAETGNELIQQLKNYGVNSLDIYISHLHDDHYGGVAAIGNSDIAVNKLYLPHESIGSEYEHQQHFLKKLYQDSGAADVVYLQKGSEFSYGGCRAVVLGPVGNYTIDQFDNATTEEKVSRYLNNSSLTTKFICGSKTFLSTGDIEAEEEQALVNHYLNSEENKLDCDVLKLAHHGLNTSTTPEFLAAVSPKYSFALNRGYSVNTNRKKAAQYGLVYTVADENENFGIKFSENGTELYKGTQKLDGFVTLTGSNGNQNTYYLQNGEFLTGINTIQGQKYYFESGGSMVRGSYSEGVYSPWRKMSDGTRAFSEKGEMYVGFRQIGDYTFYFNPANGLKTIGTEGWAVKKINGKIYTLNENGTVYNKGWLGYTTNGIKQYRYFGTDGIMKTGWFILNGKKYYLNTSTGFRLVGLQKVSGKVYYFEETNGAAYLQVNKWKKFGTKYRYFGSNGVMVTGWKNIDGKYYYFDKSTGYSYTKTGVKTIGGKKYYMQASSKGSYRYNTKGWKKLGGEYRYFGSDGVVKTGWVKISDKYYYFSESDGGVYTKTGLCTISGKKYYMQKAAKGSYRYNKTGWKKYGKKYRYFLKNGVVTTGWKKIGKDKYYFDKNGYRVTGTKKISGKTYKFSSNGKLKK